MALRPVTARRPYQPLAIERMVKSAYDGCAAFLRPGLGKTHIAQSALVEIGARRTLVCAPAQVVSTNVWSREAAAWENTAHLQVTELDCSPDKRALELILGADVFVCSYDNLIWLSNHIGMDVRDFFDAIVYDELQRMKHPGTKRFKRMKAWAEDIPVKFGLTGSPVGNSMQDLWGEMYSVCGEKALGPTKEQYLDTYFKPVIMPGARYISYEIRPDGSAEDIRQRIKKYAFSINAKLAASELPEVINVDRILKVPAHCRLLEQKLREDLEVELRSGKTLTALNHSKLASAIRQFASGAVYTDPEREEWEEIHTEKLDAVEDLIDEHQGEPLLVYTWFRHTSVRIKSRFKGAEELTGNKAQVDKWNRGDIPVLIAHPQGSGLGLNLQFGGAAVCWFDLPWSRELFDQANGRLARIGQKSPYVTATVLTAGEIDRRIWKALQRKGEEEAAVIEAVAL